MRIGLVGSGYTPFGGREAALVEVARGLRDRGHEVTVFAPSAAPADEDKGIRVEIVPRSKGNASRLSLLSDEAVLLRGRVLKLEVVESFERTACQDVYWAGEGCHAQWLKVRRDASLPWKQFSFAISSRHRRMLRIEQKSLFTPGAGRRVITISELGKREIQQCYGLEDKAFRVIYMGIDADHYSPEAARAERRATRSRAGVAEDDVIILFAGRDYWRKGLDFLISGVAALPEALCSRTQLWVIGRGKTAKYEKLAGRCSLGERLRFFENIPDTRVIYGAADVFAMPSTYEGFGRTYLEASACGLPVVLGRRHVGAAEIYTDGKDASVIDAISEPSEVAAALEPLFEREVREAMGAAGRELALQYPLSRNIDETESCLEDIKEGRW